MNIEIKNILYPTDFSELSLKALDYARSFAAAYAATLHCIHVVDEAYQYWMTLGPESVPVGPSPDHLNEMADNQLHEFVDKFLRDRADSVITAVRMGSPYLEIAQYAREQHIDLIVIATHGRSGLSHALIGSTAEKVVRKAPCPVLTVRDPEHDFIKD